MAEKTKSKGGKKNRKFGRNKVFCQRYAAENRRRRNKIAKVKRALRRSDGRDKSAAAWLAAPQR